NRASTAARSSFTSWQPPSSSSACSTEHYPGARLPTRDDIATLGEDLPLLDGIRTTRAIRRLRPDPVPLALVRKVCEAGTFAPSGGKRQAGEVVAGGHAGGARCGARRA